MDATQRSLIGRIAAYERWANASEADRERNGRAGQRGLENRWRAEIDPDGTMASAELERRVKAKRSAHMSRLSLQRQRKRAAS